MIKKILMGLGIFFVVVVIIGMASGPSKKTSNEPVKVESTSQGSEQTQETQKQTEFKVGDVVKMGEREFIVNSAKRMSQIGQYQSAKAGKEYIVVNVTIKNGGTSEISYNPFDFKVQNSNGAQEDQSFAVSDDPLRSGTLIGGGNVTGSIPFEVTQGDANLKLIFQPSVWSKEKIVVAL